MEPLLVFILIATVANMALTAPMAVTMRQELATARAKTKLAGYGPASLVAGVLSWVSLGVWFLYARQEDEWLLFIIPLAAVVGSVVFRALVRFTKNEATS